MEGRLLVIKRHCERRKTEEDPNVTETLRGDWILEPEDDPNSIGTPLTEAQIPKNPPSLDIPLDDADHEAAEMSVDEFLLWEMNQPRFRPTGDWEPW